MRTYLVFSRRGSKIGLEALHVIGFVYIYTAVVHRSLSDIFGSQRRKIVADARITDDEPLLTAFYSFPLDWHTRLWKCNSNCLADIAVLFICSLTWLTPSFYPTIMLLVSSPKMRRRVQLNIQLWEWRHFCPQSNPPEKFE